MTKLKLLLTAGILSFTFSNTVQAQETTSMSEPKPKEQLEMNFSDQNIKDFAKTLKELQTISMEYKPKLEGLEDIEKMREIQLQAQKDMKEKIEKSPLTLEKYVSMSKYLRQNEDFKAKVAKELEVN